MCNDLYQVAVVDKAAQEYEPQYEFFDTRDEAHEFVQAYNAVNAVENLHRKEKMTAVYVGRVT